MSQVGVTTTGGGGGLPPISDFIVGPGLTYTTIQDGINAANAAGGGTVYVRPGIYTEALTMYDLVDVVGADINIDPVGTPVFTTAGVVLQSIGITPPLTGTIGLENMTITDLGLGTILTSAGAINGLTIKMKNVTITGQPGLPDYFIFSFPAAVLTYAIFDNVASTGSIYSCTGDLILKCTNCNLGGIPAATTQMETGNSIILYNTIINNGINMQGTLGAFGTSLKAYYSQINLGLLVGTNSTCECRYCTFLGNGLSAITFNSANENIFIYCDFDSVINPCIAGNGAGTLHLVGATFLNDANIAATVTGVSITDYFLNPGIIRAGNGLEVKTGGAVDKIGVATLGTTGANAVTVVNADVTANSIILASVKTLGTVIAPQALLVAPGAGSFVITSAAAADTSVVMYMIVNPY